jgi:hypothetical protein
VARREVKLGGTKPVSGNNRSADCGRRPHRRQMLWQEPGLAPAGTDVHEAKGTDCHDRQAQGGPKNLAAPFTMRAIKSQSFHIRLLLIQVNELDVDRLLQHCHHHR